MISIVLVGFKCHTRWQSLGFPGCSSMIDLTKLLVWVSLGVVEYNVQHCILPNSVPHFFRLLFKKAVVSCSKLVPLVGLITC
jgi:hypothetical protein